MPASGPSELGSGGLERRLIFRKEAERALKDSERLVDFVREAVKKPDR